MPSGAVLFVMWEGGGNVNPFLGLAAELLGRGHRVSAIATAHLAERLEAVGIDALPPPDGWLPSAQEAAGAIEAVDPDVVVVDYMLAHALCACEATSVPTVALVHTLYNAPMVDGAPHSMLMNGPPSANDEVRRGLGLDPIESYAELLGACDRVIVAAPQWLDVEAELPANTQYVGPLHGATPSGAGWTPPGGDGPLIIASVGTAGEPDVERALADKIVGAVGSLDVRCLLTTPGHIDEATFDTPANVTVSRYVPHPDVLPHADLFINHAGLGAVLVGLTHCVPMVCVPQDREQPENAAAVERVGAGVALDKDCSVDELRSAIVATLGMQPPRRAAVEPALAAQVIEGLWGHSG